MADACCLVPAYSAVAVLMRSPSGWARLLANLRLARTLMLRLGSVPRPQSARASSLVSVDSFADLICATGACRLTHQTRKGAARPLHLRKGHRPLTLLAIELFAFPRALRVFSYVPTKKGNRIAAIPSSLLLLGSISPAPSWRLPRPGCPDASRCPRRARNGRNARCSGERRRPWTLRRSGS